MRPNAVSVRVTRLLSGTQRIVAHGPAVERARADARPLSLSKEKPTSETCATCAVNAEFGLQATNDTTL